LIFSKWLPLPWNRQNAKKFKNTKIIIAGYSPVKFGNIFCTLVTMATAAILNFFNPPKADTHYGGYSYKVS
jgi:hypothetical protein